MLTFSKGDGPLVSVMVCTRGRPELLAKSVASLLETAQDKNSIEFVFRSDADDLASIEACRQIISILPQAQLWVANRGKGYLDIHNWTYTLATLAQADWLMIWNDDALMATKNWDQMLLNSSVDCWHSVQDVFMFVMQTRGRPGCNEFMFIRKKMLHILGHLALSPHADNWLTRIMAAIQSMAVIPIEVDHLSGQMTDKTREESVAAYADGATARETLESDWAQAAIRKDTQKLLSYILANDSGRRM